MYSPDPRLPPRVDVCIIGFGAVAQRVGIENLRLADERGTEPLTIGVLANESPEGGPFFIRDGNLGLTKAQLAGSGSERAGILSFAGLTAGHMPGLEAAQRDGVFFPLRRALNPAHPAPLWEGEWGLRLVTPTPNGGDVGFDVEHLLVGADGSHSATRDVLGIQWSAPLGGLDHRRRETAISFRRTESNAEPIEGKTTFDNNLKGTPGTVIALSGRDLHMLTTRDTGLSGSDRLNLLIKWAERHGIKGPMVHDASFANAFLRADTSALYAAQSGVVMVLAGESASVASTLLGRTINMALSVYAPLVALLGHELRDASNAEEKIAAATRFRMAIDEAVRAHQSLAGVWFDSAGLPNPYSADRYGDPTQIPLTDYDFPDPLRTREDGPLEIVNLPYWTTQ